MNYKHIHIRITLLLFLFSSIIALSFQGCKKAKEDVIKQEVKNFSFPSEFFPISSIEDEEIRKFCIEAKRQDQEIGFSIKLVETAGFILWNYAEKRATDDGILAMFPIVKKGSDEVSGYVVSQMSTDGRFSFYVYKKSEIVKYKTESNSKAFQVQSFINYFNRKLFNRSVIIFDNEKKDDHKYGDSLNKSERNQFCKVKAAKPENTNSIEEVTCITASEEIEMWYNPSGSNNDGDEFYVYSYYITSTQCYNNGGEYVPPSDWGGNGGGGGGGTPSFTFEEQLAPLISLTQAQKDFLQLTSGTHNYSASEILIFLGLSQNNANPGLTQAEKVELIKQHINLLMNDLAYQQFCNSRITYVIPQSYGDLPFLLLAPWFSQEGLLNNPTLYSNLVNAQLSVKQAYYLLNNPQVSAELSDFLVANENSDEAKIAAKITIDVANAGILNNSTSSLHYDIAKNYLPPCCPTGPIMTTQYLGYIATQMAVLKHEGRCNYFFTCYAMAVKEVVQIGLDVIGLIPVFGEVADVVNGVIYTISGDLTNASLSYAAAIPIAGWPATGTKWARKLITLSNATKTTLNWYKRADGTISFGKKNSDQFRKLLGLASGDARQAHHLIPWQVCDDVTQTVIQKAASAKFPFHVQDLLNGIPLTTAQHLGSHPQYTQRVKNALLEIETRIGANLTPEIAYQEIVNLTNRIKSVINANPNLNIENIIF
jgi:A nuclease family of the HNH/ENDO VII superfamily with conserved AHH